MKKSAYTCLYANPILIMSLRLLALPVLLFVTGLTFAQQTFQARADSMFAVPSAKPFNGIVYVAQRGKVVYQKLTGIKDRELNTPFVLTDQFVIGSISKQFTAVMVLQELDKGHLKLDDAIHKYLPTLPAWADTVTIRQLLTHTHGIDEVDKSLLFKPGTSYAYSQIGYELLSRIAEKTSGKSFVELSDALFRTCGMLNTTHPEKPHKALVKGYSAEPGSAPVFETTSLENYVAAGAFISTAGDLLKWNMSLHGGKLLRAGTYTEMFTAQKNAVRNHPIFGLTLYGLGPTITRADNVLWVGQTGYAPGFTSMNYYYPDTQTSIIVLSNIAWNLSDLKETFYYHSNLLNLLHDALTQKKPL